MVAVLVVQLAIHQVIRMVSVGHRLMAAAGSVTVIGAVAIGETGGAIRRILMVYLDPMLVHVVAMGMMETAVVEIVGMVVVLHRRVAAVRAVLVVVAFVNLVRHGCFLRLGSTSGSASAARSIRTQVPGSARDHASHNGPQVPDRTPLAAPLVPL
jgi:hypothetical protein